MYIRRCDPKYTFTYISMICVIKRPNRAQVVRDFISPIALLGGIDLLQAQTGGFEKGDSLY